MEDAAAIDAEPLPCPLCRYDLRATTAGRCPECGHAFDAADLRRRLAEQARLPWFVESETPRWWTGLATSAATLWPTWFWRRVRPQVPLRSDERWRFAAVSILVPSVLVPIVWNLWADWQGWQWWWRGREGDVLTTPLVLGGMLLLTVTISAVFQQTLRRAGIESGHLWRVAVYGCDFRLLWLPVLLVVLALITYVPHWFGGTIAFGFSMEVEIMLFTFLAWVLTTWRVVAAYVLYLRLPWAFVTGLLVQAVVGLAMFVGIVVLNHPPW